MDKRILDGMRKTGRGMAWTLLPMQAVRSLSQARGSLSRIGRMVRTGKPVDIDGNPADAGVNADEAADIAVGKQAVLKLEEHARFEMFVDELEWTADDLDNQRKALWRSHTIRLVLLAFASILLPFILYRYGFSRSLYCMALMLYLGVTCLKAACMYIQIEERALWSFAQLRERPGFWLYRRAFWFLD